MAERIITTTGVAGEPGPSLQVKVDKSGKVTRTLIPPPVDQTMGQAAIIIATQEHQEED